METVYIINKTGKDTILQWLEQYGIPEMTMNVWSWYAEAEDAMSDAEFNRDTYIEPLSMRYYSKDGMPHSLHIKREWFDVRTQD